jgi:hypothetical protein
LRTACEHATPLASRQLRRQERASAPFATRLFSTRLPRRRALAAWAGAKPDTLVRRNVQVGKRPKGGYECELDIVAFHPEQRALVHLVDATHNTVYVAASTPGFYYTPRIDPELVARRHWPGGTRERIASETQGLDHSRIQVEAVDHGPRAARVLSLSASCPALGESRR